MSYNSLFRKAGRILQSYLNLVEGEDPAEAERKKKIFDEYLREEARRRTQTNQQQYQRQQQYNYHQNEERKTYENRTDSPKDIKSELNYYKVFGLKPDSSIEEIKAYKILIAQYHPDKVVNLGIELQNLAKKKSQEINEAYSFIKSKRNF